jgi:hypothetical protein
MTKLALPCIVCGAQLRNVVDDVENQPDGGTAFITHGHYGSTVFDPMNGEYLEINVCDQCLVAAGAKERVLSGRDRRPVVSTILDDSPARVQVGWERVDRPLVPWHEYLAHYDENDVCLVEPEEVGMDIAPTINWNPGMAKR